MPRPSHPLTRAMAQAVVIQTRHVVCRFCAGEGALSMGDSAVPCPMCQGNGIITRDTYVRATTCPDLLMACERILKRENHEARDKGGH